MTSISLYLELFFLFLKCYKLSVKFYPSYVNIFCLPYNFCYYYTWDLLLKLHYFFSKIKMSNLLLLEDITDFVCILVFNLQVCCSLSMPMFLSIKSFDSSTQKIISSVNNESFFPFHIVYFSFLNLSFTLVGTSHIDTMLRKQGEQEILIIFLVPVDPLLLIHPYVCDSLQFLD